MEYSLDSVIVIGVDENGDEHPLTFGDILYEGYFVTDPNTGAMLEVERIEVQ